MGYGLFSHADVYKGKKWTEESDFEHLSKRYFKLHLSPSKRSAYFNVQRILKYKALHFAHTVSLYFPLLRHKQRTFP
jgi:hypothetical protein